MTRQEEYYNKGREEFLKDPSVNRDYTLPEELTDKQDWLALIENAYDGGGLPSLTEDEECSLRFAMGFNEAKYEFYSEKNRLPEFKIKLAALMKEFNIKGLYLESITFEDDFNTFLGLPEEFYED